MSTELTIVDWATILSGFATTGLVGFVAYQLYQTRVQLKLNRTEIEMTQKQMDGTLRGWLGIKYSGIRILLDNTKSEGKVIITVKNFGAIPAVKVSSWLLAQTEPINVESIDLEHTAGIAQTGAFLPGVERDRETGIIGYSSISKENPIVYIYHVAQYEYANQVGLYGYYGSINIKTKEQRTFFEHAS